MDTLKLSSWDKRSIKNEIKSVLLKRLMWMMSEGALVVQTNQKNEGKS